MNSKRVRQLRRLAYETQNHLCFYCAYPMWEADAEAFSRFYGWPPVLSKYLKCTAEHLQARRDGGKDIAANIVAACLWCNEMRHQGRQASAPGALAYKLQVSRLIAMRQWHPLASIVK